jgi:hypothetical protein
VPPPPPPPLLILLLLLPPPPPPPLLPLLPLLPSVDDIAGVALMAGAASSTARRGSLRSGVKPNAWVDRSIANANNLRVSICSGGVGGVLGGALSWGHD